MDSPCGLKFCKKKDFAAQKSESNNQIADPNNLSEELIEKNEMIVKHIILLKRKRNEMIDEYTNYKNGNSDLSADIERLTYKVQLISKSLAQRMKAKVLYDKTLKEIETKYSELVQHSGKLLDAVEKEINELNTTMAARGKDCANGNKTEYDNLTFNCLKMPDCNENFTKDLETRLCCYDEVPVRENSVTSSQQKDRSSINSSKRSSDSSKMSQSVRRSTVEPPEGSQPEETKPEVEVLKEENSQETVELQLYPEEEKLPPDTKRNSTSNGENKSRRRSLSNK